MQDNQPQHSWVVSISSPYMWLIKTHDHVSVDKKDAQAHKVKALEGGMIWRRHQDHSRQCFVIDSVAKRVTAPAECQCFTVHRLS